MVTAVFVSSITAMAEIKIVPGIAIDFPCTEYSLFKLSLPEINGTP